MITPFRRESVLAVLAFAAPVLAIAAVRHLGWPAHPAPAHAASLADETATLDDGFDPLVAPPRSAAVPEAQADALRDSAAAHAAAWASPIFPPPPGAPADAAAPDAEHAPIEIVVAPALSPTAAAYADYFRVTSLMAARDGNIAVIDRKLRRIGDAVGSGVIVESIDLDARVVVLRTADGAMLTRRPER